MSEPNIGITELAASAISAHEALIEFTKAGFTRREAFELVQSIIIEGMNGGKSK